MSATLPARHSCRGRAGAQPAAEAKKHLTKNIFQSIQETIDAMPFTAMVADSAAMRRVLGMSGCQDLNDFGQMSAQNHYKVLVPRRERRKRSTALAAGLRSEPVWGRSSIPYQRVRPVVIACVRAFRGALRPARSGAAEGIRVDSHNSARPGPPSSHASSAR